MKKEKITSGTVITQIAMLLLLLLTFFPLLVMINMSFKKNVMITTDFFGLPRPFYLMNYLKAFKFVFRPILNSMICCLIALVGVLVNVSLAGYAFGKMEFKGRKTLYTMVLVVMMIPYTITIVPCYKIVESLHILNTFWALILPWISGQEVFGIIIAETYYRELPKELFDAAEIDGASAWGKFWYIGLPLSRPILITVGITAFVAMYNDYIWPTIAITSGDEMKTFCQIVLNNAAGKGSNDMGLIAASFIIGTIPLIIVMRRNMKYYVQGLTSGAVKG
jgi:ABC-type glycerol-3-phosphate transport system permease component